MDIAKRKKPALTLGFVKSKFDHWRATRNRKGKIPDELLEYAKQLYPQYTCGKLCDVLKLSHRDFKSKLMSTVLPTRKPPSFAECVLPAFFDEDKKEGALEFIRKDGSVLKLNGFSAQNLLPVVSLFVGDTNDSNYAASKIIISH
jgi:hypothetical protein